MATNVFEGLTTIAEINASYKRAFAEQNCTVDKTAYWSLSDAHRRALETVSFQGPKVVVETDPNAIHPRTLRNWAAQQGIPLGKKGRVKKEVENAYRAEHDMPLLANTRKFTIEDTTATFAEIRTWARTSNIECGERGRLNPKVIAAYAKAHTG